MYDTLTSKGEVQQQLNAVKINVPAQECNVQCNMNTQTHYPIKEIWAPHVYGVLRVHDNSLIKKDCHRGRGQKPSPFLKLKFDNRG